VMSMTRGHQYHEAAKWLSRSRRIHPLILQPNQNFGINGSIRRAVLAETPGI
jgi:hypothetical protein